MGILNPLYDIVAWLIMHIHAIWAVPLGASSGVTWVLTIVTLVVFMRLLLLPLFVKQMHAQRKMLALNPQVQKLRKQYKGDKQKLNEEMMKLYKENGANPLSGCLPLVAQLPVWFALLNVLRAISENKVLYGMTTPVVHEALAARIFGVTIATKFLFQHPGSSGSDKLVIGCTVVISSVTTYLTVRQSMRRGMMQQGPVDPDNPMAGAQKYMAYIAPLFALSGLYWQYGLVVYWLTSNVWTLGQQYFLFKSIPPLNSPAAAEAAAAAESAAIGPAARITTVNKPNTTGAVKRPATGAKQTAAGSKQAVAGKTTLTKPSTANGAQRPAAKPATAASPKPASTKPAAKPTATASAKVQTAKTPAAKQATPPKKPADAKREAASLGIPPPTADSGNGGGVLGRLRRSRSEPEPEPTPQEVTIVRQQRTKQSRSKRTGKR
ncbi:MAG TPA: membrane protein insertase YidC [Streptosporangiaceae bacterium]